MVTKVPSTASKKIVLAENAVQSMQRLRLRRLVMAMVTYAVVILATFLTTLLGLGKMNTTQWTIFIGLGLLGNSLFFVIFYTNANLHFSDSSLTREQIVYSTLWGMVPLYALPEARSIVLLFYLPAFSFGMLRLTQRQYLSMVAIVMGLYVSLLGLEYFQDRPGFRIQYELFLFILFGILLTWLALFGGYVSNIRRQLLIRNKEIQKSHERIKDEFIERKQAEEILRRRTYDLGERVKELNCLYSISRLVEKPGISLEEILQGTLDLIPPGWQYSEITCARIIIRDQEYKTSNFRETIWKQTSNIAVHSEVIGKVEVFYLEEKPEEHEGPFLKEERNLIYGVSQRLGLFIEQRQANEVLRESEERMRSVLETSPVGISIYDETGQCFLANDSLAEMIGATKEQVLQQNYNEVESWKISGTLDKAKSAIKENKNKRHELVGESTFAQTLHLDCYLVPFASGQLLFMAHDITARKQAEEEREMLYDELKSLNLELEEKVKDRTKALELAVQEANVANHSKSNFLANMSHELRTPLNAVIGFSELLRDKYYGELNEKQADYIKEIIGSGKHLLSLINDILDLSKVEAGKMELEPSQVNIKDLLENSLVMIKEKAHKHGISLDLKVPEEMSELKIQADERKLKQVMFNLLSNAAKFTPDGGEIRVTADFISGSELRVSRSEQLATRNRRFHRNLCN